MSSPSPGPLRERMQEMFTRMVEAKDASLVDIYYDPDFLLTTNGRPRASRPSGPGTNAPARPRSPTASSTTTTAGSSPVTASPAWITAQRPGERAHRIEVVLVAAYPRPRHPKSVDQGQKVAR